MKNIFIKIAMMEEALASCAIENNPEAIMILKEIEGMSTIHKYDFLSNYFRMLRDKYD